MISCGEPSGDLYAAALAREIRAEAPASLITGFGGEHLRAAGAELLGDFSGLSVTGLLEVVRLLPRTYLMYRHLVASARETRPDIAILDYSVPELNGLDLSHALKREFPRIEILLYTMHDREEIIMNVLRAGVLVAATRGRVM